MIKNISIWSAMLLILPAFTTVNAQKVPSYSAKWYPGIVKENEEDLTNLMQYNEKSKFLYLLSNDESNLYINLQVTDKNDLQKIMRYGLTTWINPEGKHKKTFGIEFPASSDKLPAPAFDRKNGGGDRKDMRMAMMNAKNGLMILKGFGNKGEEINIDPRSDEYFHGRIDMLEGGKVQVNLVIPLNKLGLSMEKASKEPFGLGFETGYMDVTGQGMASSGGSGMHGGGGMYGGGGPGGGMPGGGGPPPGSGTSGTMGESNQQYEQPDIGKLASPTRLWIKGVLLSPKQ